MSGTEHHYNVGGIKFQCTKIPWAEVTAHDSHREASLELNWEVIKTGRNGDCSYWPLLHSDPTTLFWYHVFLPLSDSFSLQWRLFRSGHLTRMTMLWATCKASTNTKCLLSTREAASGGFKTIVEQNQNELLREVASVPLSSKTSLVFYLESTWGWAEFSFHLTKERKERHKYLLTEIHWQMVLKFSQANASITGCHQIQSFSLILKPILPLAPTVPEA